MDIYDWLSKRTPRSVDELRPWPENPRLNPEETHVTTSDYVEDIISEKADRENFCDLVKSIAERGFIPADPIVVWQNPDNKNFMSQKVIVVFWLSKYLEIQTKLREA